MILVPFDKLSYLIVKLPQKQWCFLYEIVADSEPGWQSAGASARPRPGSGVKEIEFARFGGRKAL
jgi:hypothetical protein